MSIEEVAVELPAADAPPLVTESFGNRTVFEMELALQKACQTLPPEYDSHENRCFIARSILARVGGELGNAARADLTVQPIDDIINRLRELRDAIQDHDARDPS